MKIRYAFLIVLMFAAGCSSKKNLPLKADNNAFDIFLFIGQSNMAGHAKIEPLDTATLTSVFLFNDKNQWEKAANTTSGGLNRYSNVKGKTNSLSLSYAFSRKINQYTSR
ncbi:MAG TPA: sialate O-acetylesterase, partial [Sphingobacteriaceae bacterium]